MFSPARWWWVDQPITKPITGSSLDFLETYPGVPQDMREDPELDKSKSKSFRFCFVKIYRSIESYCRHLFELGHFKLGLSAKATIIEPFSYWGNNQQIYAIYL